MFLSQTQIEQAIQSGELGITPFTPDNLKPASYTFTLGLVLTDPNTGEKITMPAEGYTLAQNGFILGKTMEILNLNNKFICILSNRGSVARQGIDALGTDFGCEPDTNGTIGLTISNRNHEPVILKSGMLIVKGLFSRVES